MHSHASSWLVVGALAVGLVAAASCSPGNDDADQGTGASGGSGGATGGMSGTGTGGGTTGGTGGATGGAGGAGGATGGAGAASGGAGGAVAGAGGAAGTVASGGSAGSAGAATGGVSGSAGAAAGGAGSGGDAGSGGSGGAATLAMPIMKSATSYVLEFGDLFFEANPMMGGRVVSVKLGGAAGANLLGGMGDNVGSIFWPAPQTWPWPPTDAGSITNINDKPYTPSTDATSMTLVGMNAAAVNLAVTKKYAADLAKQAVVVTYTMNASAAVMTAPWEITRFAQKGVTFYPTGSTPIAGGTMGLPPTTTGAGATWLTAPATRPAMDQKMLADGTGGWLAHAENDWVVVKKFTDTPANMAAPNEAEIEIYLSAAADYMEVEQQGAYGAIPNGGMVSWTVTWFVRRLPQGVTATAGNQQLFDFVAGLVQ
jgi:hypothetical protein